MYFLLCDVSKVTEVCFYCGCDWYIVVISVECSLLVFEWNELGQLLSHSVSHRFLVHSTAEMMKTYNYARSMQRSL